MQSYAVSFERTLERSTNHFMSDSIKKLQELFGRFPTIGSRTAGRFVMYLINQPKEMADELIKAIQELKNSVNLCSFCFNPFESQGPLCPICQSPTRNKNILCIVEKEVDLNSIENTKKYTGLYFILGGNVSSFRMNDAGHLRLKELQEKIKTSNFTEIIIATNTTPEGKATSVLIERALKECLTPGAKQTFTVTHLGKGLPVGGELEYADDETLESAFEGRK